LRERLRAWPFGACAAPAALPPRAAARLALRRLRCPR